MIILDTNVISELMKDSPESRVAAWTAERPAHEHAVTTISIFEIGYGIARLVSQTKAARLRTRFQAFVNTGLGGNIFDFDTSAADALGPLMAARDQAGRSMRDRVPDAMVAAIALVNGCTIATRDIGDFTELGVDLVNPWTGERLQARS